MDRHVVWKCAPFYGAFGLIAFGMAVPAEATNLLINPGFESPTAQGIIESPTATGWTFYGNAERATYYNNTPGGAWSDWERDFEPAGGVYQVVGNIVPGSTYTLSAYQYFEPNFPFTGATVDLELTWQNGSGTTVGTPNILNIFSGDVTNTGVWTQYTLKNSTDSNGNPVVAPAGATQVQVSFDYSGPGASGPTLSSFVDDADLEGPGVPPTTSQWALSGSGDWNALDSWNIGVIPNGVGVEADFFGAITTNHNVYSDVAVTAGTLNFNNANTYVIDGAGSLTLQTSSGNAQVIVQKGTQEINLPTTVASNTVFNVSSGAKLIIADPLMVNSGKSVTQSGSGTVTYESTITLGTGASIAFANSTHAAALNLQGTAAATVSMHTGSSPTVLQLDSLSLGGGGSNAWTSKLDVVDNDLILHNGSLTNTTSQIKQGLNLAGGSFWNGSGGIISSTAAADTKHVTAVGVLQNDNGSGAPLYTSFGGVSGLSNADVLVRYTYFGDADLSGAINAADYLQIDNAFSFNTIHPTTPLTGWYNGDFNYDGSINGDDYTLIDNAFNSQSRVSLSGISAGPAEAIASDTSQIANVSSSSVPEPGTLTLFTIGTTGLLNRRRRRTISAA